MTARPDPATEIRMTTLHATHGINYWSRRPVTRMDLIVGAYDEISSADVPGFTEQLIAAMPGLVEHRCSIGERGGFITRLRRGTYAPHIVEHVALELQNMIGHDVGFGRTRGGDVHGEYTLVFEHDHEPVGLRAAALAMETVQRAFAGTLESVNAAVDELATIARTPDPVPVRPQVFCGITGGNGRADAADLLRASRAGDGEADLVVDVAPGFILQQGLPYACSEIAIILDTKLDDVPPRYREQARAERLVAVLADGVRPDGFVVCPAREWEVQSLARDAGCRVAIFTADDEVSPRDASCASAIARVRNGRIVVERRGDARDLGTINSDVPIGVQVAAALAAHLAPGPTGAAPAGTRGTSEAAHA